MISAQLPTKYGLFNVLYYKGHLILSSSKKGNYVRIHSKCLTGDALFSVRCDCGDQLERAFQIISEKGGLIIYLNQEGRGIGLKNKIAAYALQDEGLDTVEANLELGFPEDLRDYSLVPEILNYFGLRKIKLLTNNPEKVVAVRTKGFDVVQVPLKVPFRKERQHYLETKRKKLNHTL